MFEFDLVSFAIGVATGSIVTHIFIYINNRMKIKKFIKQTNKPTERKPRLKPKGMVLIELLVYIAIIFFIVFFAFTCNDSIKDLSKAAGLGCYSTSSGEPND